MIVLSDTWTQNVECFCLVQTLLHRHFLGYLLAGCILSFQLEVLHTWLRWLLNMNMRAHKINEAAQSFLHHVSRLLEQIPHRMVFDFRRTIRKWRNLLVSATKWILLSILLSLIAFPTHSEQGKAGENTFLTRLACRSLVCTLRRR